MSSLILATTTRLLQPLLLLYALFLLLVGHDEPGGGFTGGLVAAAAYTLQAMTEGAAPTRRALHVEPTTLLGAGLLVAIASAVWGLAAGDAFFSAQWAQVDLPGLGEVHLGTPLLFDAGVLMVVMGVALTFVLGLLEEV